MKQRTYEWVWWLRRLVWLLLASVTGVCILSMIIAKALTTENESIDWAGAPAMAIKRVSPVAQAQNEPNFLNNLDCNLVTYRLAATSTTRTGCFSETAFGLLDTADQTVIFNGTDEGLPITDYSPNQALAPWPRALNLVSFSPVNTGGSYINLYKIL